MNIPLIKDPMSGMYHSAYHIAVEMKKALNIVPLTNLQEKAIDGYVNGRRLVKQPGWFVDEYC